MARRRGIIEVPCSVLGNGLRAKGDVIVHRTQDDLKHQAVRMEIESDKCPIVKEGATLPVCNWWTFYRAHDTNDDDIGEQVVELKEGNR